MPRQAIDLTGIRKGRLTVIEREGVKSGSPLWRVRCDCGTYTSVTSAHLRGKTVSCGCVKREGNRLRHGMARKGGARSRVYTIWAGMKDRCLNPKATNYPRYGGQGVTVCSEWMEFENFLRDMGEPPSSEYSLDRIDTSKGYEPGNCRWATDVEQARNQRKTKLDPEKARFIREHAEMTYTELARMFGCTTGAISGVRTGRSWKEIP